VTAKVHSKYGDLEDYGLSSTINASNIASWSEFAGFHLVSNPNIFLRPVYLNLNSIIFHLLHIELLSIELNIFVFVLVITTFIYSLQYFALHRTHQVSVSH
jgi:hypothetical protein